MQFDEKEIKSTLTITSKDDNGNSVIENEQEVYNFDKITKRVAEMYRANKPQHSCDALYIKDNDNIFLIEFKNARKSRIGKKELQQKAYDSIMTLQMGFFQQYSLNDLKEKTILICVYNDEGVIEKEQESISFNNIKEKISHMANQENSILFDLEKYKGVLYRDILTVEKRQFMNELFNMVFN